MPLTERTERALEACYDAILAPTRWSSALQLLGESFGAASCTLYEHDRENSPAPVPMSVEHEAYSVRWERNQAHAPDPHIGPYLQKTTSFIRLLCMRNAAALKPLRRSSSIVTTRLGSWSKRCRSRRSAVICSAPVA